MVSADQLSSPDGQGGWQKQLKHAFQHPAELTKKVVPNYQKDELLAALAAEIPVLTNLWATTIKAELVRPALLLLCFHFQFLSEAVFEIEMLKGDVRV